METDRNYRSYRGQRRRGGSAEGKSDLTSRSGIGRADDPYIQLKPEALPLILDSLTPSSHKLVSLLCDMISPLFSDSERTGTVNDIRFVMLRGFWSSMLT